MALLRAKLDAGKPEQPAGTGQGAPQGDGSQIVRCAAPQPGEAEMVTRG
jgi:hypothetical protein